jgi:hypothetical protein
MAATTFWDLRQLRIALQRRLSSDRTARLKSFAPQALRWSLLAFIATVMSAASGPALARRVAIDFAQEVILNRGSLGGSPLCVYSAGLCATPTTLFFSINLASGPTDKVYVYDNGLVSLGKPLTKNTPISSLAELGQDVFTAGYLPGGGTPDRSDYLNLPAMSEEYTDPFLQKFGYLRLQYFNGFSVPTEDALMINASLQADEDDPTSGKFFLAFYHGYEAQGQPDFLNIDPNTLIGYYIDGKLVETLAGTPSEVENKDFFYEFDIARTAAPEPTTWIFSILGFGLMGCALRGRGLVEGERPPLTVTGAQLRRRRQVGGGGVRA